MERTGGLENFYTYTGREWDEESGLYHYRYRYYEPIIGRFISPDPLGLPKRHNSFRYVSNNPMNLRDAFGLSELFASCGECDEQNDPWWKTLNPEPDDQTYVPPAPAGEWKKGDREILVGEPKFRESPWSQVYLAYPGNFEYPVYEVGTKDFVVITSTGERKVLRSKPYKEKLWTESIRGRGVYDVMHHQMVAWPDPKELSAFQWRLKNLGRCAK
jgi:RHS repeat-associated protein